VTRTYAPDGNLCLKVLQARDPEHWLPVQKSEKNITIKQGVPDMKDFSDKELELLESIGQKQLEALNDSES
jgi:hypothetical protein